MYLMYTVVIISTLQYMHYGIHYKVHLHNVY